MFGTRIRIGTDTDNCSQREESGTGIHIHSHKLERDKGTGIHIDKRIQRTGFGTGKRMVMDKHKDSGIDIDTRIGNRIHPMGFDIRTRKGLDMDMACHKESDTGTHIDNCIPLMVFDTGTRNLKALGRHKVSDTGFGIDIGTRIGTDNYTHRLVWDTDTGIGRHKQGFDMKGFGIHNHTHLMVFGIRIHTEFDRTEFGIGTDNYTHRLVSDIGIGIHIGIRTGTFQLGFGIHKDMGRGMDMDKDRDRDRGIGNYMAVDKRSTGCYTPLGYCTQPGTHMCS